MVCEVQKSIINKFYSRLHRAKVPAGILSIRSDRKPDKNGFDLKKSMYIKKIKRNIISDRLKSPGLTSFRHGWFGGSNYIMGNLYHQPLWLCLALCGLLSQLQGTAAAPTFTVVSGFGISG